MAERYPEVMPDKPWVMRTYAGHSSAAESNALYRRNLAKGQTGLSVAFDLPTQTGYDPDHVLSRGEVGNCPSARSLPSDTSGDGFDETSLHGGFLPGRERRLALASCRAAPH